MKKLMAVTAAVALLLPALAVAQDGGDPITWVAFSMTKEGKLQDAVKMEAENNTELLDKLMADGTILSWGMATPVNHHAGRFDANLAFWVTAPNWASIGKWADATVAMMAAASPEDSAAMMAKAAEIFEARSHYDQVVSNVVYAPPSDQRPAYFYLTNVKAKRGMEEAVTELYTSVVAPVAKKLTDEGTIAGYGLQLQDLIGDSRWTHRGWVALPNLGALDAYRAALDASMTPEIGAKAAESFDYHQTDLLMILHVGGAQPAAN